MTDEEIASVMGSVSENNDTNVSLNDQVSADSYDIVLNKDDFIKFTKCLDILSSICNDCDIREGKIRCRTNDHKNMILMDLTSIIGNRNISFCGLKNKLSLLSTFNFVNEGNVDNSVVIEANDSNFEFSDSISRLVIRRPIATYLENVYLSDDDFESINHAINREDAVLFNVSINNMEKKRIAKLCDVFCSSTVTFNFNGNIANYITQTSSKDNVSETTQQIPLLREINDKKSSINNLSFVIDSNSDMVVTCYMIGTEFCMVKSQLEYFGIPIQIYTKARIVDINDAD